jgi:hypothetical protein
MILVHPNLLNLGFILVKELLHSLIFVIKSVFLYFKFKKVSGKFENEANCIGTAREKAGFMNNLSILPQENGHNTTPCIISSHYAPSNCVSTVLS